MRGLLLLPNLHLKCRQSWGTPGRWTGRGWWKLGLSFPPLGHVGFGGPIMQPSMLSWRLSVSGGPADSRSETPPFWVAVSVWEEEDTQRLSQNEGHEADVKDWKEDLPEIFSQCLAGDHAG